MIAEKSPGSAWTSEGWAAPILLHKTDLPVTALRVSWWVGGGLACLAAFQTGPASRKLGVALQSGPGSSSWSWSALPDLPG